MKSIPTKKDIELDTKTIDSIRDLAEDYSHLKYPEISVLSDTKLVTLTQVFSISKKLKRKTNKEAVVLGEKIQTVLEAAFLKHGNQKAPRNTEITHHPSFQAKKEDTLTSTTKNEGKTCLIIRIGKKIYLNTSDKLLGPLDHDKELSKQLSDPSKDVSKRKPTEDEEGILRGEYALTDMARVRLDDLIKNWSEAIHSLEIGNSGRFRQLCPEPPFR